MRRTFANQGCLALGNVTLSGIVHPVVTVMTIGAGCEAMGMIFLCWTFWAPIVIKF